ncbi:MAG TPA: hypothetical protein VFD82_16645 [Planctomycetota bacterium]|nr:hypothetical protein [Planctomycetota bacterium]
MHLSVRCLASLAIVSAAAAQVPRGWAVASRYSYGSVVTGGLVMFHPLVGAPQTITGLPPQISGFGLTTATGAAAVLVDSATGDVVVGTHTPANLPVDVHVVTLTGTVATSIAAYNLGIAGAIGWTDQMAWVGGDILVTNRGQWMASGPLAGAQLGWVRPRLGPPGTPGTVVPIPVGGTMSGTVNALAVDAQGQFAYLGRFIYSGGLYTSFVYRVPLSGPSPAMPVLLTTVPDALLQLAFAADGGLLAGVGLLNGTTNVVHAIDVGTGAIVASWGGSGIADANGLAVDLPTGDMLVGDDTTGNVYRSSPLGAGLYGAPGLVANCGLGISGIALRPALSTYGQPSYPPGANTLTWVTTANPGGGPNVGNLSFSLSLDSSPGADFGLLCLSLGQATPPPLQVPPLGITLLLDPGTVRIHALVPPQLRSTTPLPIPNDPGLASLHIFAQMLGITPSGWSASPGLWISVF